MVNGLDERALGEIRDRPADNEGNVVTLHDDASAPEAALELGEAVVERFGGLDILVNNVGIAGPSPAGSSTAPR